MGPETFYSGISVFTCPNCENTIEITYEASEYPIGMLNDSEVFVSGGELLSGFDDIEFDFDDDLDLDEKIYSFNEQSLLYLPQKQKIITDLNYSAFSLITEITKDPRILYQISPRKFEEIIAKIFAKHGFKVELTKKTRDGGRDIIAIRADLGIKSKYIIECKRYAVSNPVRVDIVRNLYGVQTKEGANKSVLATTSFFTRDAKEFANAINTTKWAMDLKNYSDIVRWIKGMNDS
ncbi:hypothetical protein DSCW_17710 [Desulfosarcina widdelii]|uniref:Restriction endonuclease type IV Mrr domain-containing protein n=1 Tax=Desulfosarcina widdelii TaxID=947919 RepID=A0A5K7Z7A2_9BACT|nr:restriction endonuclease [Desulfosarcina widdelii]BBO74354.1 hypothetical protein DSCW_17710 [Desulfosarcina widdelii]